jgi:hypothetical protein
LWFPLASAVLSHPHPGATNDNVLGNGTVLDALIHNSSAVITVTAVPEPGSLVLVGFAASAAGLAAWRRRRAAKR